MALTMDEFRKIATFNQNKLLTDFLLLSRREGELGDAVNRAHAPYREAAERERNAWGFSFRQVADLVVDQEIAPAGYRAAAPYQQQLDKVREEMQQMFRTMVEQGLGVLGIVQRHYESYVGEPMPNLSKDKPASFHYCKE